MKTKATILLIVLGALITMSFKKEKKTTPVKTKTYYYYAFHSNGLNYKYYDKAYFTPLMTITINEDSYYPINEHDLALQFGDYMDSEYTNYSCCPKGAVFDADVFDKSKAMEYYRSELKRFKKVVKQYDFEYLPERR